MAELAQDFAHMDLERVPDSSKHMPFPHSTWLLVPSRSRVWPLVDLNPRAHSPHTGPGEGLGVVVENRRTEACPSHSCPMGALHPT